MPDMSGYFEKKVAVVTGAASGIGLGITEKLLSSGARAVFMADLKQENLDREAARLNLDHPGKAFPLVTDVTKPEQVEKLVHEARAFEGHLDFVFNNAGVGVFPIISTDPTSSGITHAGDRLRRFRCRRPSHRRRRLHAHQPGA